MGGDGRARGRKQPTCPVTIESGAILSNGQVLCGLTINGTFEREGR